MTGAETAAPARRARPALGANVRKLVGASAGANLADGISQVAYPWLASAVTRNPMLIALIAIAQQLPWLVLTLPAGVLADRTDRRLLMVGANVVRVVLSLGVGAAVLIAGDVLPTPDQLDVITGTRVGLYLVVLVATLLFGAAEVVHDNAAQSFLPAIVPTDQLEQANGRLMSVEIVANRFGGPPLGSLLLGIGYAIPFFVNAGAIAVAALLVAAIAPRLRWGAAYRAAADRTAADRATVADAALDAAPDRPVSGAAPVDAAGARPADTVAAAIDSTLPATEARADAGHEADAGGEADVGAVADAADVTPATWRAQIAEGFGFLWRHRLLRALAIALGGLNLLGNVSTAVWVLYAQDVLGTSSRQFALIAAISGIGGVVGGAIAGRVLAAVEPGVVLAVAMSVNMFATLLVGLTSSWVIAAVVMSVEFVTIMLWNVLTVSLRQSIIPDRLLGRVNSVYRFFGWGVLPIGTLLGGLIVAVGGRTLSHEWALRAPWLVAAGGYLLVFAYARRHLTTAAIERAKNAAVGR